MKNYIKAFYIFLLAISFAQCSKEYKVPNDLIVQDFVWKGLNAYYLHQDEIEDLSDRRFNSDIQLNNYLSSFLDYNELFSSLLIVNDTKSTLIEDYNVLLEDVPPRTAITNGMEFGIIAEEGSPENVIGYVTHILPSSNASTKSIERGEFFNAVNGLQLTRTNFNNLLLGGADTFILNMVDFDGNTVTPNAKTVSLTREDYTYSTTFKEKTISIGADNVGYLMYNNNFSKNYIDQLNTTFLDFKNNNVNELVLDLRYNIGTGSFVRDMAKLASLIAGQFPDETFIKEKWNSKAQPWFEQNQPDSLVTKFPSKLNVNTDFNSLNLTDVYIILNGDNFSGSSTIELLVNSLKPYINVHLIGAQTAGNNTGSITLYNSDDYDFGNRNMSHTVALQPIVLSFYNKNDQTYENGFIPNINLCPNEDILNLGVLGERSDPILDRVLTYVTSGNTGTNVVCNPNNYEYLYNSINAQREIDKGIFIKQNLPNTN
ncbi:hypothetical protein H9I45_02465 [Polaribacter haliotis]|uniref:Tail specific protease domain-containing protein n=1 Tax=Polaribacter haliotis TaxID=1888915 RepID=A0A7L8AHR9_9FLAO|nr:S41 family peptidase [Polaribacter haliotis]QOD61329.1 hypothetical protein H9I45_02465 [Polaribacter haliotis]